METTVLSVAIALAAGLLLVTTYLAVIGTSAAAMRARYLRCPLCHHHYLATGRGGGQHECPHGLDERAYQYLWSSTHHRHLAPAAHEHTGTR